MKRKISYLWTIPSLLLFPVLHVLMFYLQFRRIPYELLDQSWVFAPIGFISVAVLIYFLRIEEDKRRRKKIVLCFILAIPFGWFYSLMIGLFSTAPIVIAFIGALPMILGILFGRKLK